MASYRKRKEKPKAIQNVELCRQSINSVIVAILLEIAL
jgi:hypothetical protein